MFIFVTVKNIVKNIMINVCFSIGEDDMRLACQMGGLNLSKLAIWIVNFKLNVFKGVKKSGPIFLIPKKAESLKISRMDNTNSYKFYLVINGYTKAS